MRAGSRVMRASACASGSFISMAHFSVSGSSSSRPVAPASASANGSSFDIVVYRRVVGAERVDGAVG